MSAEAEASRPVRPEWSTEGQAGLRARRWAWPYVSIGLVPKIRVVRVDLSSQAQVQRSAHRARPGKVPPGVPSQLVAARWVLTVGRSNRTIEGPRKPRCHGVEASKLPSHGTADDTRTGCGGHSGGFSANLRENGEGTSKMEVGLRRGFPRAS